MTISQTQHTAIGGKLSLSLSKKTASVPEIPENTVHKMMMVVSK